MHDIVVWNGCITRYHVVVNLAHADEIRLASIDEQFDYLMVNE